MHESMHTTATRHAPRTSPMVALVRELGAAYRISVARLRPAESDVRGRSSTWSKTAGAVRQVRGDAEVGFLGLGWVPRDGGTGSRGGMPGLSLVRGCVATVLARSLTVSGY